MKVQFDKAPSSAHDSNGVDVRYGAAKRQVPKWRWRLLLGLVLLMPLYLLGRFIFAYSFETVPAVVQTEQAVLRAGVAGHVLQVAAPGDRITIGKPAVTVTPPRAGGAAAAPGANPTNPAAINPAAAQAPASKNANSVATPGSAAAVIGGAVASLLPSGVMPMALMPTASMPTALLPNGAAPVGTAAVTVAPSPAEAQAQASEQARRAADEAQRGALTQALSLARSQAGLHAERVRTLQALRRDGAATEQELQSARLQALQAQADVVRAQGDLDALRARIAQVAASAATAQNQAQQQAQQQAAAVASRNAADATPQQGSTAPFDAVVVRRLVNPGDWIERDTEVVVIQGPAAPTVRAYISPGEARYAQLGREATLRFMDGGRLRATVVGIGREAERTPADRMSPLTARSPSIVVELKPQQPLPPAYRIHMLPLDVRFDWIAPWS